MNTLTLEALQWGYHSPAPLSLTIRAGEIWVILGQNGSGKTTLLHTLMGLIPPRQGNIYINNQALKTLPAKTRAKMLGLLFQTQQTLFPLTVQAYCEDARYPHGKEHPQQLEAQVARALETLALTPLKDETLHTLSGGERQRAAFAAVLAQNPWFYLLDEPTNHLDVAHQIKTLKVCKTLANKGHGLITSLHDLTHAEHIATHALLLFKDGSHQHGKAADLFTEPLLSRLYECKLQRSKSSEAVFWRAEMCYNEVTSFGRDQ